MPKFYTFPHFEINVKDESRTTPLIPERLALHRPIFFSIAERGPVGVPVYGNFTRLSGRFGAGTFDMLSKYYRHPTLFLERSLRNQNSFFVRLASEDAKVATLVLECRVHHQPVIQYEKDADGYRITDENGDYIPITDDLGDPLTEQGTVLQWNIRELADGENPRALIQSTETITDPDHGELEITAYPILAFNADSPGDWGNKTATKLFWDEESNQSAAADMGALIFNFGLSTIPWGADTAQPVRTRFLEEGTTFTFKKDTTDRATMRRHYLEEVVRNDYHAEDLLFDMAVYSDNVKTIGERVLTYESAETFPELTGPYMVNIFTGKTMEQQHLDHTVVDTEAADAVLFDENILHYFEGGDDGDTSDEALESLTREWLTGNVFPEIKDRARFPITHLYDSGYEMETKEEMINFLGVRDDVKAIIATQSAYEDPNTKAEDQSAGSYLRGRALLHPESFIYGTQACRVTILQQCGTLTELSPYTNIVPATLDNLTKRGIYQGAMYMKGKPKGLPRSEVTVIKDINWFPVDDDFKQASWDNALNYMQYFDMTRVHYPDVISVYPYLTSLLSDDIFNDMLVHIKHIVRFQWAKFAGVDDPLPQLIANIKESVGKDIYAKLGNHLRAEVNPHQTDLDAELGYALTVEIAVYGTMPNRVWNVIVPVRRELVA